MAQLGKVRSISDVKANLLRPALTSVFEVEIPIPRGSFGLKTNEKLNLMCSDASLPGSSIATMEVTNDFVGVTERYAHRRVFDDRIDLSFYVDAKEYLPIKFFETWLKFVVNEGPGARSRSYSYNLNYPNDYIADQGLIVRKFEKDRAQVLEYEFIRAYPIQITSMPVSYESSSLLKCTVSMTYLRYLSSYSKAPNSTTLSGAITQAAQNAQEFASSVVGGLVNAGVDQLTGNDLLGDVAGGIAKGFIDNNFR
tara:strand:- start:336 stop:1094 length:759 start_codon:yes stop_codon:yes gene_type:complete